LTRGKDILIRGSCKTQPMYIKNLTLILFFFISLSVSQPWLQRPPSEEAPREVFDSSQMIADKIVQSPIPVLVDFWAIWCGPCRLLGPTIEEIKKKYEGKILVLKVNVDVNRGLSSYFRIQAIPTVFIIADKTVIDYLPGVQPKEVYEKAVEKAIVAHKKKPLADTPQSVSKTGPSP
jgi:thioredoxin 1